MKAIVMFRIIFKFDLETLKQDFSVGVEGVVSVPTLPRVDEEILFPNVLYYNDPVLALNGGSENEKEDDYLSDLKILEIHWRLIKGIMTPVLLLEEYSVGDRDWQSMATDVYPQDYIPTKKEVVDWINRKVAYFSLVFEHLKIDNVS